MKSIHILIISLLILSCTQKPAPPLMKEDYSQWMKLNQNVLTYPVPGHERNPRNIYINSIGERAQIGEDNSIVYPEGTIIAKTILGSSGKESEVKVLTNMLKDSNHPDNRKGWVWFLKDPVTGKETIQKGSLCITCHQSANDPHPYGDKNPRGAFRDYVFFPSPDQ